METIASFSTLIEQGGNVMWGIFFISSWMWALILERYYYFWFVWPGRIRSLESAWRAYPQRSSRTGLRLRQAALDKQRADLHRQLPLIRTLASVLPMLGLLGTVVGMIDTFYVMTVFGMGNPRGVAGGVSVALTTTMAGLITSLPGVFLVTEMRRGIGAELEKAARRLA